MTNANANRELNVSQGLHWIDVSIIAAYAAGMIALGWYYSRRQRDAADYFTGGGNMSPTLIGISLFATLLSTISYLSSPGEMISHGPVVLTGAVAIPVGYVIVGYLLIPALMQYRLQSAYELLETKLGLSTRLLGAGMFVTLTAVLVSFWNPIFEDRSISITWINPSALIVGIGSGCLASRCWPRQPDADQGSTRDGDVPLDQKGSMHDRFSGGCADGGARRCRRQ